MELYSLRCWLRKDDFLEKLALEFGNVKLTCEKYGHSKDTVQSWKKMDPIFFKIYSEIRKKSMSRNKRQVISKVTVRNRKARRKGGDNHPSKKGIGWKLRFLAEYRISGSKVKAAEACEKKVQEIMNALDKQSDFYDKEFTSLMREEELRNLNDIEDNLIKRGKNDPTTARFILTNFMPDKYRPEKEAKGLNVLWFDSGGSSQARGLMTELFGDNKTPLLLDAKNAITQDT